MKIKLLIMMPHEVGKNNQTKIIKDELVIAHISTGELLRDDIAKQINIGVVVKNYIYHG